MNMKKKIQGQYIIKHFLTITRHRHEVIKNCFRCGIGFQGCFHDLSKYSPAEFLVGVTHYQGTRSPNEGEREDYGYSKAWMHHKGRNKHHFEYWTDYNPATRKISPVKMPYNYVVEMFCDRIAASKIYLGDKYTNDAPYEYYQRGIANRMIHPDTAAQLDKLLKMLKEQGEEKTFAFVKNTIKKRKRYF